MRLTKAAVGGRSAESFCSSYAADASAGCLGHIARGAGKKVQGQFVGLAHVSEGHAGNEIRLARRPVVVGQHAVGLRTMAPSGLTSTRWTGAGCPSPAVKTRAGSFGRHGAWSWCLGLVPRARAQAGCAPR